MDEVKLTVPLPNVLHESGGEYRVIGSRITLYHIISAYRNGIAPHAMVFHYPTLSLFEIEKVIEFYHANRAEVNDFMTAYQAALDRLEAALPTGPSRAELLARFEARKKEQSTPAETE